MEKKINRKFANYLVQFKDDIKKTLMANTDIPPITKSTFMNFIYSYEGFSITKEDLQKRTRVKNVVPLHSRCCAKKDGNEQCTRRRKNGSIFCGTHIKGTPHGKISDEDVTPIQKKVTVRAVDINGIIYYIDDNNNVYDPQDIMDNKINPTVIAKWQKRVDNDGILTNDYYIPAYEKTN